MREEYKHPHCDVLGSLGPVHKPKNPQNPWNIFFRDILERKAEKKGLDE